mgnify:CR=1 FL=1
MMVYAIVLALLLKMHQDMEMAGENGWLINPVRSHTESWLYWIKGGNGGAARGLDSK